VPSPVAAILELNEPSGSTVRHAHISRPQQGRAGATSPILNVSARRLNTVMTSCARAVGRSLRPGLLRRQVV